MQLDNYQISYPKIYTGTDISKIIISDEMPNLKDFFLVNNKPSYRRLFVTDATVASLECMKDFIQAFDDGKYNDDQLIILGSGEPYKTIESVLTIAKTGVDADFTRNDCFVGIGGGVICDLTAFAASIFKRGISVELAPTTLLAMVDASIGGKTGCDFDNYKNMIGTFHPAKTIYYFTPFIQFLAENQYNSGLAEAFKTGLIYDEELYDLFKNESEKILSRNKEILLKIIEKCVKAKSEIVEKDFMEKNIRSNLNLGHTFAHALESIAGLGVITHGAAVAWGIGRAATISLKKDYCMESFVNEIFTILKLYNWETEAIPSILKGGEIGQRFLSVMHKDKKNNSSMIKLVIPKGFQNIVREDIPDSDILSVLK